jgi:TRAF3-interacting protein 1
VGGVELKSAPSASGGSGPSGGFTDNDIEFMKKAIQILCQNTNPLGKSIDFVTDDIDSMSAEYEYWRRESLACRSRLEEQQRITEEVVQPLQDQLADIEEKIKEQQAKINAIKSQIMHNDISIQNLLYSVIQTR